MLTKTHFLTDTVRVWFRASVLGQTHNNTTTLWAHWGLVKRKKASTQPHRSGHTHTLSLSTSTKNVAKLSLVGCGHARARLWHICTCLSSTSRSRRKWLNERRNLLRRRRRRGRRGVGTRASKLLLADKAFEAQAIYYLNLSLTHPQRLCHYCSICAVVMW